METPEDLKKRQNRERQARYRKRQLTESSADDIQAKKRKHAEYVQGKRQQETSDETQHRREVSATSQRLRIAAETPNERQARLEVLRRSQQLRIELETPEQRQARVEASATSQRLRIESEIPSDRQARLEGISRSFQLRVQNETQDERQARRDEAAQIQRLRRSQETSEETLARLEANNRSRQLRFHHETEEEREIRLLADLSYRHMTQEQQSQAIREEAIAFDEEAIVSHHCGPLNIICQYCASKNFIGERPPDKKFTLCCRKGKVKLPKPQDINGNELSYPTFLRDLMSNRNNVDYRGFRENIRCINNAVSFASMGAKIVEPAGRGPYVFKVHGQTYHKTSHLLPPSSQAPQYAQLYVIDSTQATSVRQQHAANQKCSPRILDQIDRFFRANNRLAQTYQLMREVENQHVQAAIAAGEEPPQVSMIFKRDRQSDQRRFNEPTSNEIAMIFCDRDGEPPLERDIRIYPRNLENPRQQFVNLNILSPNMDPMTYALLYPYGEPGWQPNWQCESYADVQLNRVRVNVSMQQYKVAQTAIRDEFNPILNAGKLTQQWMVDSYLQVEANNLNFIKQNQSKLRAEQYQGLVDHIANVAQGENVAAGVPVVLPSSFSGSPRNMRETCCDAMSIFSKHGAPDLFITFTANPDWDEIKENLAPGETASDRPDLVARTFKVKLDALIDDLTKHGIFGRAVAFVYTIEFQKRGLPHAHILVTLIAEDKFTTAEKIDRFISAEIPMADTNPRLREIVLRTMTHGPCGDKKPNAPCMENGACKKKFPKSFNDTTKPNIDGYPVYRRRRGVQAQVRGVMMDNQWIVPYSPYLSLKYNAHINVEACTSLRAIKYIYKYIYKGFDCANIVVTADGHRQVKYDEISNFISCRYVSAPEAIWRLRENKMHDRSHSVMRLPVHLQNQQRVTFQEGHEEEAVAAADRGSTKLESWFRLNVADPNAHDFLYTDIPYHYVYEKGNWKKRQRGGGNIVARMYTVSPRDEERFYLRTLLLHTRGALSFASLRTVDGVEHVTFKAAAQARGLLESDEEWINCLQDAVTYLMPRQLRETFVYIIAFCHPALPLNLWEQFRDDMILDYIRTLPEEESINMALHDIQKTLQQHGLRCMDVGLPSPQGNPPTEVAVYDIAQEALDAQNRIPMLNERQREAFEIIREALDNENQEGRCFFIDGPGGSGKTFLYKTLMAFVRGRAQVVLPFATTGIAATLLKGGRTVHSGFKLPVPILDTSVSNLRMRSNDADVLREAALIIIDEATMLYKDGLRCIDRVLRELMVDERPFGGKIFLLGGDFRQTLPVVTRGTRNDILENCIKSSPLWQQFRQLTLSANMRSEGQQAHNDWLLQVGEGTVAQVTRFRDPDIIEIPQPMIDNGNLIDIIFGHNLNGMSDEELSRRVILVSTNAQALDINREIVSRLNGDPTIFYSADSVVSEDENDQLNFPVEFLNELTPSGMPPHVLLLKPGAVIMLLRNLNAKKGLCNGTRLIVEGASRNTILARIISECNRGDLVIIPRIVLAPSDSNLPFVLRRRQFPVTLAYSMTITKSQGQTFEHVGIDIQTPVFSHGQLYVALSRATNAANLKVKIAQSHEQGKLLKDEREFTRNVVFKEIFRA